MIKLINGPYNGKIIEDRGVACIHMSISTDGDNKGAFIGMAVYEPNEERTLAFWEGNNWYGILEETIPF